MNQSPPSRSNPERRMSVYALLALLLALFSYYWANRYPEYVWDGPIILFSAIGLFFLAFRRVEKTAPTLFETSDLPPSPMVAGGAGRGGWTRGWSLLKEVARWRLVLGGASIALTFVLLSRLLTLERASYIVEVWLWLGSIGLFVLSVAPPVSRPREDWSLWWEMHRNTVLIVTVMVVSAFMLRVWRLDTIPSTLGGDEASQGLEALRVLAGEIRNPFTTGWLGVPTMSFFFQSTTIELLGPTIIGLRLPWVLLGTITVLLMFWLVNRLYRLPMALTTTGLLATYHYHIHYSRLGSNQIADPFFMTLALLFLYRARQSKHRLDWAITGIVVGVAQYFYAGARLTIVVIALCIFYFFWLDRTRRARLRDTLGGALTVAGSFMITAAPMMQYAYRFPNDYNARVNMVGIFQSGWLENEVNVRGVSMWTLLWEQFQYAFFSFNVFPDHTVWYGSSEPLMDGIWAVLFLLGLLYATFRLFPPHPEPKLFPFVAWWWSGMLLGGMLTENPPSTQRLIVLAPPACFFVALVLWRTVQYGQHALLKKCNTRYTVPVLLLCVLVLSWFSISRYFLIFTPTNVYGSHNGEIATQMGFFLAETLQPEQKVVFLGPPVLYLGFASIPYLAPQAQNGIDLHEPLTQPPTLDSLGLSVNQQPLFIAGPWRIQELEFVEQAFPGGTRFSIPDKNGSPLFWVYEP